MTNFWLVLAVVVPIAASRRVLLTAPTTAVADCPQYFQQVLQNVAVKDFFEATKNVKLWRPVHRIQRPSYQHQWDAAKKVPLVKVGTSASSTLWDDVLLFEGYSFERQRLSKLGRISETGWHIVNESNVQNICELSPATLKALLSSPPFLETIMSGTPNLHNTKCRALSMLDAQSAIRSAMKVNCFGQCGSALAGLDYDEDELCKHELDEKDFTNIINNLHPLCAKLPYDMVEHVVDHEMQKTCMDFPLPSVLWEPNDKAPGSLAMRDTEMLDSKPVCAVPERHMGWGLEREKAMQHGICPEGTRCKCLNQAMRERPTVTDLRGHGAQFFVRSGVACFASFAKQYAMGFLVSTFVVNMAIGGATLGSAALAAIEAPLFIVVGTAVLSIKGIVALATFNCQKTLGCWPSSVVHLSGRGCRLKPTAKYGNSPVWFLPPPGTKVHNRGAGCVVDKCELREYQQQRLGFSNLNKAKPIDAAEWMAPLGGPLSGPSFDAPPMPDARSSIFNCQLLSYEAMTWKQRSLALQRLLDSGIGEEYRSELDNAFQMLEATKDESK